MRAMRFVRIGAWMALSLVTALVRPAAAGPLILAGHDPDDHGFTAEYKALFDALYANVTKSGDGILAIGADPGSPAGNWIGTVAGLMTPPQTVTYVNDAAISSVSFGPYKILHIPSTTVDTAGGIHATNENPLLSARAADIAAFINSGGGLFGLTQDQVADAYDYLGPFAGVEALGVPSSGVCASGHSYDDVTPTAEGSALGITSSNVDGCCWHNVFTSFAPFLNVLATANEPGCPNIDAIPSVIGCLQCSLPGQMNLEPVLDLNPPGTQHAVTATFVEGQAPNDPVAGVLVTFGVISGPNVGATGDDTTDANGQATFTYTGNGGPGVDVVEATAQDPETLETITSNQVKKFWDADCQPNGIPDTCDLDCGGFAGACTDWVGCGASADANANDVPDECDECVTDGDCDDDVFCNGAETCVAAECAAGPPPSCDDAVACTADACNEDTEQCDHVADDEACDDGAFCNGDEFCSPVSDCQPGDAVVCNDGIACTSDFCDEAVDSCAATPNHGACANGEFCDGEEVCDPLLGCLPGSPVTCDLVGDCEAGSCDEGLDQCVFPTPCCGNGVVDGDEQCEPLSDEICNNLLDDDGDGLYDCADPQCDAVSCSAACLLVEPCTCIEEDPAVILLAKTPNFFKIHGRIPGDATTTDPQGDGVSIQLTNALGVIYEALLPPDAFIERSSGRFKFKHKAARDGASGVCTGDPAAPCTTDGDCAVPGGTCAAKGLYQMSLRYRLIENVPYLTFRVKAYGDLSLATESCMTTQFTTGDAAGALQADWTKRKSRAWLLRVGDYSCDAPGCASQMP